MSAAHKAQSPVAAGQSADETKSAPIVASAEKTGKPIIAQTKQFASLQARLALRGHELIARPDGSLLVHKWGLHRVLADLPAAEQFALEVGCPR